MFVFTFRLAAALPEEYNLYYEVTVECIPRNATRSETRATTNYYNSSTVISVIIIIIMHNLCTAGGYYQNWRSQIKFNYLGIVPCKYYGNESTKLFF